MKNKYPTRLTWEEENPSGYRSFLFDSKAFRNLRRTIKKIKDKRIVDNNRKAGGLRKNRARRKLPAEYKGTGGRAVAERRGS